MVATRIGIEVLHCYGTGTIVVERTGSYLALSTDGVILRACIVDISGLHLYPTGNSDRRTLGIIREVDIIALDKGLCTTSGIVGDEILRGGNIPDIRIGGVPFNVGSVTCTFNV